MKAFALAGLAYLMERYHAILWSLWLVLGMELLSRGSFAQTFQWVVRHPILFFTNVMIAWAATTVVLLIVVSPQVAYWIIATVGLTLAYLSGAKLAMMGLPLLPYDFKLVGEVQGVIQFHDVIRPFGVIVIAAVLGFGILLVHKLARNPSAFRLQERAALAAAATVLIASTYADVPLSLNRLIRIPHDPWDQAQSVRMNGLLVNSLLNLKALPPKPKPNRDLLTAMAPAGSAAASLHDVQNGTVKPDIIVLLSESFWDPMKLPGVTFNQDPIPFFRSLMERHSSGWMLSPQFGGETANVEFEVLTGLSMRFLPQGTVPYMHYVENEVDSLASILARQGYDATAISPWPNLFFHSDSTYRNFGFARFISEEFFPPVYSGQYLADSEVMRIITEQTKKPGPHFIFANTAENHEPYPPKKFPAMEIQVSGLSGEPKTLVESYAQGCRNFDRAFETLIDHFSHSTRPTIIATFGDHLPILGENYEAYKAAGYIRGEEDADFLDKMYRVPVVVWNNYLPVKKEALNFSPAFLGPYLLELAGRQSTPFMTHLRDLSSRIPIIPPRNRWAAMNIREVDLAQYEAVQDDVLFGDRTSYGPIKGTIVNPHYINGFGVISLADVKIDRADPTKPPSLVIHGQNLPPLGLVYLGESPLETQWSPDGTVRARVPPDLDRSGTFPVQVRVLNRWQDLVVAQSNPIAVTLK